MGLWQCSTIKILLLERTTRETEQEKDMLQRMISKKVKGVVKSMAKRVLPPSVVCDFARQVWFTRLAREEWVYHGDLAISATPKKIVCRCRESESGEVDLYEFDQMYGVGRCNKCNKMHWYKLS